MTSPTERLEHEEHIPHQLGAAPPPLDRDGALQRILHLMEEWHVKLAELVDPAERQAALGKARRLVDFWGITAQELEGPLPPRPSPQPQYRYTHPKTGESWNGQGPQPAWLRRCLIDEGYRLDEVRSPFAAGLN